MGVIRLGVLAVLFYLGWLLIRGITGKIKKTKSDDSAGAAGKANGYSSAHDVLVEDPVCHTLVPKHQAIRLRKDETTYYFCSDKCCDTFSESVRGEK